MPLTTNLDTEDRNDDTGDTPENNHIFIAQIPGPTNTAHGWGHGTNQQNVNATLAWRGHTTVLERNPLSFILMCVNAGGGPNPRKKTERPTTQVDYYPHNAWSKMASSTS